MLLVAAATRSPSYRGTIFGRRELARQRLM
jgi:hypothetical protein